MINGEAPWRAALDEEVRALRALFDRVGVDAIAALREEVERLRAERDLLADATRWDAGRDASPSSMERGMGSARARVESIALCGRALTKDAAVPETELTAAVARLLLRAYDAEAECALQSIRSEQLVPTVARLSRARDALGESGRVAGWAISVEYHRARIDELHAAAAEAARGDRDEALRAVRAAKVSLERERAHYQHLCRVGDATSAAMAATKLTALGEAIRDVEARERRLIQPG
jgi:hypothetical protein